MIVKDNEVLVLHTLRHGTHHRLSVRIIDVVAKKANGGTHKGMTHSHIVQSGLGVFADRRLANRLYGVYFAQGRRVASQAGFGDPVPRRARIRDGRRIQRDLGKHLLVGDQVLSRGFPPAAGSGSPVWHRLAGHAASGPLAAGQAAFPLAVDRAPDPHQLLTLRRGLWADLLGRAVS